MSTEDTLISRDLSNNRVGALNLAQGGQLGIMPAPFQWNSSAPHVRQNTIAVLAASPTLFRYTDNPEYWVAGLRSLIELMPKTIEGITDTLNVEYGDATVGQSTDMLLSVPIDANRDASEPNFTWDERYGEAIVHYWSEYIRMFVMDPDTKKPGIISSPNYIAAGNPAILPEHRSFAVMFIEPDETLTQVVKARFITNMMPRSSGARDYSRTIQQAREVPEVSIPFTGLPMPPGNAVNRAAKAYLDSLQLQDIRPTDLRTFNDEDERNAAGIAPDVAAAEDAFDTKISQVVENS